LRSIFVCLVILNLVLAAWIVISNYAMSGDGAPSVQRSEPARVVVTSPELAAPEELNPQAQAMCAMVGPFTNLARADILVERLQGLEVPASLEEVGVADGQSYWVYLPPAPSRDRALQLLAELQALNIDSYVIPEGELANGISLGLFSEAGRADAKLNELTGLEYDAQIKIDPRTIVQSWVVAPAAQASALSPELWSELLAETDGVSLQQNYCPAVASSQ
jgi:hypothetical protein